MGLDLIFLLFILALAAGQYAADHESRPVRGEPPAQPWQRLLLYTYAAILTALTLGAILL